MQQDDKHGWCKQCYSDETRVIIYIGRRQGQFYTSNASSLIAHDDNDDDDIEMKLEEEDGFPNFSSR